MWQLGLVGAPATLAIAIGGNLPGGGLLALVCDGAWGLLYLLYRYTDNHWNAMRDWSRALITLGCGAIVTAFGVLTLAWLVQNFFVVVGTVVGIAFLVFYFAGGGSVADLVGHGPKDREAMRDANLIGINNALDEIKKKL